MSSIEFLPMRLADEARLSLFGYSVYEKAIQPGENLPDDNTPSHIVAAGWMLNRLEVVDLELIYAFRPPAIFQPDEQQLVHFRGLGVKDAEERFRREIPPQAEFFVQEIGARGVEARTTFSEPDGRLKKTRKTLVNTFYLSGQGMRELDRLLDRREQNKLNSAIRLPHENISMLRELAEFTLEEKHEYS